MVAVLQAGNIPSNSCRLYVGRHIELCKAYMYRPMVATQQIRLGMYICHGEQYWQGVVGSIRMSKCVLNITTSVVTPTFSWR